MSTVTKEGQQGSWDEQERQVQAFIHGRFVSMFLSQSRRAQFGLMLAATLVAWMWFQGTGSTASLAWLGLVGVVVVLRLFGTERFVQVADADQQTLRIIGLLVLNGFLMAMPLTAFGQYSQLQRAAMSIILLTTATASVTTTAGYRSVFAAFAAPMLLPLALAWAAVAWQGDEGAAVGLALLVAFYLVFLLGMGRQVSATFVEACRFRHGEQLLTRELTQALEAASQANRAKTQFLAAASHDLRQPIHSMNVLVAAIGLRELEPQAREIVNLLGTVNQTLSKQLDTLLDISKLDAGVVRAELVVQPLDSLVRAVHAATAPVARERGLALSLELTEGLHALTDAALLGRTLSNLLDNALKFTAAGGSVRVLLRREDEQALLEVSDNGIGIAEAEQERVFAEFYQVNPVERERHPGLGLGLSIVRRMCALLDVQLQLRSESGAGTTVSLRLPLASPDAMAAAPPAGTRELPRGLRVLVVDDEPMVRHSMRLLFTQLGGSVHLADSAAAAARLAADHPFDLVLSDLRLRHGESGLAAVRAVHALQPAARAVLITGDMASDRILEARAAGVPLLYKPVALDDLMAALQ